MGGVHERMFDNVGVDISDSKHVEGILPGGRYVHKFVSASGCGWMRWCRDRSLSSWSHIELFDP